MRRLCFMLFALFLLCGCDTPESRAVDTVVEYELTMYFKDGSTKVFVGRSVNRDNATGQWSYIKADGQRKTFVGEVKVRPVLKTSPRDNFETLAEDPSNNSVP